MNTHTVLEPPLLVSVGEAGRRLGISERQAWRLVGRGELEAVSLGARATRVVESSLRAYLERLRSTKGPGGSDTT